MSRSTAQRILERLPRDMRARGHVYLLVEAVADEIDQLRAEFAASLPPSDATTEELDRLAGLKETP